MVVRLASAARSAPSGKSRWRHTAALAAVVTLGSAGLVGISATAAQAGTVTADQACTNAGGHAVDLAQGWATQCVFSTKGTYSWTPAPGTRAVTFDISGAQGGTGSSGGTAGYGGEVQAFLQNSLGSYQIDIGGQDGSSGTGTTAFDGTDPVPFAGGAGVAGYSGNGGGATVVYGTSPSYAPWPILVAGGGGGASSPGDLQTTSSGYEVGGPAAGGSGGQIGANGQPGPNVSSCFLGICSTKVQGGGGGFSGGNGGGGGASPMSGGAPAQAGSYVYQGGNGEGGANGDGGGGGGGGYFGGGAGSGGYTYGGLGSSGGGGGGGGTSWAGSGGFTNYTFRDGSKAGDGTAVITTLSGSFPWNSGGVTFTRGQNIASGQGYQTASTLLIMQTDGNLVEYNSLGAAVWAAGTSGHPGAHASFGTDGNLVIYADQAQTQPLWWTGTNRAGGYELTFNTNGSLVISDINFNNIWSSLNTFTAGMTLQPGVQFFSVYGNYLFTLQTDGNLVEYDGARKAIWASNTAGDTGDFAVMQADGNFVIYADQARQHALFATGTSGSGATEFAFQNDGNLVLYRSNGTVAWAGNTAGK